MFPSISFRFLSSQNFSGAMTLKNEAGWNQVEADWEFFLNISPQGCFVAEYENQVIGTAATINYSHRFSWVSMVLVDPKFRGQGIARRLMELAIESVADLGLVRLDASDMGRPLYEKMGFVAECQIVRLLRSPGAAAEYFPQGMGPISADNLEAVCEADQQVFGADRRGVLTNFLNRGPGNGWVKIVDGKVSGYIFTRNGTKAFHIGPLVAEDMETARELLLEMIHLHREKVIMLDTFASHTDWLNILKEAGFEPVRFLTRMNLDKNVEFGITARQYALAGLEFG
ncbi:MAG: GNAT family N-acetyltransferase [Bacteroidia bacterium]